MSTSSDPVVDRAYNVRAGVGEDVFHAAMARYREDSVRSTTGLSGQTGLRYDDQSEESLDIWGTGAELRPVFLFVHGGYWRALSRADSAFMAAPLASHGVASVVIDYTLAPAVNLAEIVRQVRAAVAWVYRYGPEHGLDPERIVVGGSSAGGHLTGMAMLGGWQAELGLPDDVVFGALPISGLFDLRPLVSSFVNEWMRLDPARAWELSPGRELPAYRPPTVVVVADGDGEGFVEQSRDFYARWRAGNQGLTDLFEVPGRNHYDVVLELADPDSRLTSIVRGLCTGSLSQQRIRTIRVPESERSGED